MKVRNSLKSLRGRHRDNRIVRRKGRWNEWRQCWDRQREGDNGDEVRESQAHVAKSILPLPRGKRENDVKPAGRSQRLTGR